MQRIRPSFIALLLVAATSILSAADSLQTQVAQASDSHFKAARENAEKLIKEGKLDEANKAYLSARDDKDLTVADCFFLGNVFFKVAPELSAKYLGRAYKALPDNPEVNLEWAMVQHRKGETDEAARCYERFLEEQPANYLAHTLLADCMIRGGNLKGAVEHWNKARHPNNHTGIDFAICEIYGPLSPYLRHDNLAKAVKAGDTSKVEEMVSLAITWDNDWWNGFRNEPALQRSLDLAAKSLAGDPNRLAELRLFVDSHRQDETGLAKWLREKLAQQKLLIGAGSTFPVSSLVAEHLCALVTAQKLATRKQLLDSFGSDLRKRSIDSEKGDVIALNMLAAFLLPADENQVEDEKLNEVDRIGWEKCHDARFAASFLVSALRRNDLTARSPLLLKALKDFPDDPWITRLALELASNEKLALQPYLVSAIKAEFRHLSISTGIIKDSYRLKSLFAMLEEGLK